MTSIPLVDLQVQHHQIEDEIRDGFARVCEQGSFILGPDVTAFEAAFAAFSDAAHCVGVANGTDALELALRAAGVDRDHEVIVPVNTFIATALAVVRIGAVPVFVDCDPVHLLIDPAKVEEAISERTRAIVPVHLYGQMAPMGPLEDLASQHDLRLIEDAAQAQGAKQIGRSAGSIGISGATSFYPGKNLGAYGDAGAVTSSDDSLAQRVRRLRNYGSEVKYHHPSPGFNSRLDSLQAVVLLAKLKRLTAWNDQRRDAALRYDTLLEGVEGVTLPATAQGNEHVWHLYVVRVQHRDDVLRSLQGEGIGAGIHYPIPLHLAGAFEHLGYRLGQFPVAERAAGEILSLPLFPGIEQAQIETVTSRLRAHVQQTHKAP